MPRHLIMALVALSFATAPLAAARAQVVPPAPELGKDVDDGGRPLPFGKSQRLPATTPAGSGKYKAIMAVDPSLPAHVLYYPANLKAVGKLPVVAWGNGACINAGNRFRAFLSEIASHGYVVAANGVMANPDLDVGPQENPKVRAPGEPPPPPPPPNPNGEGAGVRPFAHRLHPR
jgi:hypothetical protein